MKSIYLVFFAAVVCVSVAQKRNCNFDCIALYDPVCGVNKAGELRTFSLDCVMDGYNCENPNNEYKLLRKGKC